MQQTVYLKSDKKNVHVVAAEGDRYTRCGVQVKKNEEDEVWNEDQKYLIGQPTPQAVAAVEIETLYLWWVETRPARIDPSDAYPDPLMEKRLANRKNGGSVMDFFCKGTPEEEAEKRIRYDQMNVLEKQYADEDDEMFIRLIKIRKSLWT